MDKILLALIIFSLSAGTALACQPIVTITEPPVPSVTVTEAPSPEPTASESATPTPENTTGDGRSDGLSDGQHQSPDGLGCAVHECKATLPSGPPATGHGA